MSIRLIEGNNVIRSTSTNGIIENDNSDLKNMRNENQTSIFTIDRDLYIYLISINKNDRINPLYSILSLEIAKIIQLIIKGTNLDIDKCCNSIIELVNNENYNIDSCDRTVFHLLIFNKISKIALAAQNQNNINFNNYLSKSKEKLKKIVDCLYEIYNHDNNV